MERDRDITDTELESPPPPMLMEAPPPRKAGAAPEKLTPWLDRWKQPKREQLVALLSDQHRKPVEEFLRLADAMPRVQPTLIWYGLSWHWTIQYNVMDESGKPLDLLCYMVPNPAGPLVCVPLTDEMVNRLPMRRLHKFIRTGIRAAKRAVALQWGCWNVVTSADVEPLADLLKRKYKMVIEPAKKEQ